MYRFRGLVVMISVLHTEGPQFDPGRNQFLSVDISFFTVGSLTSAEVLLYVVNLDLRH